MPGNSTTFVMFDPGDFKASNSAERFVVLEFLLNFPGRCSSCEGVGAERESLDFDGFEIDLKRLSNPPLGRGGLQLLRLLGGRGGGN